MNVAILGIPMDLGAGRRGVDMGASALRNAHLAGTLRDLGHTVTDLDWYVVYAALRHGVVMSRVKRRMIHFGEEERTEDPDDVVMHRAALEALMDGTYQWD